ncbi:MAG: hypothetical protein MUE99_01625 [Chitinophagaceae bacterium]|nr:hypothetical protein [Chitinophagaceae bacterium]
MRKLKRNEEVMKDEKRICLWSSPRNVSTAFMYSWAQRPDTVVVDEPLYGHYLTHSGTLHPGREEIIESMECDANKIIEQMTFGSYPKPVVFFKHMSHHMPGLPLDWMEHMVNIFFIRHPGRIISSYAEVINKPVMDDIGIAMQWEQYQYARQKGFSTIVLDSGELLKNPEPVLKKLCDIIGIPFYNEMLQWPAGPRPEDGVWAKYWYAQVHRSTGFQQPSDNDYLIPGHLNPLYTEAMGYYDKMRVFSLSAD